VTEMLKVYGEWWDVCRPLMINEDADITKNERSWIEYLKDQKAKGSIPELVIPGVQTDVRVVSMSSKKGSKTEDAVPVEDERAKLLKLREERRKRKARKEAAAPEKS